MYLLYLINDFKGKTDPKKNLGIIGIIGSFRARSGEKSSSSTTRAASQPPQPIRRRVAQRQSLQPPVQG